jgi:hypothetical protein
MGTGGLQQRHACRDLQHFHDHRLENCIQFGNSHLSQNTNPQANDTQRHCKPPEADGVLNSRRKDCCLSSRQRFWVRVAGYTSMCVNKVLHEMWMTLKDERSDRKRDESGNQSRNQVRESDSFIQELGQFGCFFTNSFYSASSTLQ